MKFNSDLINFKISEKNKKKIEYFIEEKYGDNIGAPVSNFGNTRKFRWIKRILWLLIFLFIALFIVQLIFFPIKVSWYSSNIFEPKAIPEVIVKEKTNYLFLILAIVTLVVYIVLKMAFKVREYDNVVFDDDELMQFFLEIHNFPQGPTSNNVVVDKFTKKVFEKHGNSKIKPTNVKLINNFIENNVLFRIYTVPYYKKGVKEFGSVLEYTRLFIITENIREKWSGLSFKIEKSGVIKKSEEKESLLNNKLNKDFEYEYNDPKKMRMLLTPSVQEKIVKSWKSRKVSFELLKNKGITSILINDENSDFSFNASENLEIKTNDKLLVSKASKRIIDNYSNFIIIVGYSLIFKNLYK